MSAINDSGDTLQVTDPMGQPFAISPGAEIPPWAEHQLADLTVEGETAEAVGPAADTTETVVSGGGSQVPDQTTGQQVGPPARTGKGGGVAAWRKYSADHGVDGEGLDVDEIVAKLREVGVPVE